MTNRIILDSYSKGSFGNIFKDTQLNIYKVTIINENGSLAVSNINEILFFNKLLIIKKSIKKEEEMSIMIDMKELINYNIDSYKSLIDENIFMQSFDTKHYNLTKLQKNFFFTNKEIENKYINILIGRIDKYLLFSKLPFYELNLSKFIEKYHIYSLNNFDTIAKKIIKSLALLHHNGFLHGDLKSANILINDIKNICLTDFGAVKMAKFDSYHLSCTISSRCPEDLNYEYSNENKIFINSGFKSDIWSLGLIFAEIILGYNPSLKLYKKLQKTGMDLKVIEINMLNYYKNIKHINVLELAKNHPLVKVRLNDDLNKKINVIEKMLMIEPNDRYSNLEEVYEKLFEDKIEYNFELTFDYEYTKLKKENNIELFYKIRKENYQEIINVCNTFNFLFICPLIIDIMDRLLLKLIKRLNDETLKFNDIDIKIIMSTITLIVSGIYNQKHLLYNEILTTFNIQNNIINVAMINKNLLDILYLLDYDLTRPFNIFYCSYYLEKKLCKCFDENNNVYNNKIDCLLIHDDIQKQKLKNLLNKIIQENILGISPEYYYDKLTTDTKSL
jgi:serine/threonine protein kinase